MNYHLNEILIVTFNRNSEYKVASEGPTNPFESDSHDEVYVPEEIIVRRYHNWQDLIIT
jgi:hypothetical protein